MGNGGTYEHRATCYYSVHVCMTNVTESVLSSPMKRAIFLMQLARMAKTSSDIRGHLSCIPSSMFFSSSRVARQEGISPVYPDPGPPIHSVFLSQTRQPSAPTPQHYCVPATRPASHSAPAHTSCPKEKLENTACGPPTPQHLPYFSSVSL